MGLDTVEIVMEWEQTFNISIPDVDAASLETPRMAIDYICARIDATPDSGFCPTVRAFNRIRQGLCCSSAIPRKEVKLSTALNYFYRRGERQVFWKRFVHATGFTELEAPGLIFGPKTVRGVVQELLSVGLHHLRGPTPGWTVSFVRSAVRSSVKQFTNRDFRDDDHFIRDIGLC